VDGGLKSIRKTFADTRQPRIVTFRYEKLGRNEVYGVQAGKKSDILTRFWQIKLTWRGTGLVAERTLFILNLLIR
jgi:hypothetical protein